MMGAGRSALLKRSGEFSESNSQADRLLSGLGVLTFDYGLELGAIFDRARYPPAEYF